MDGSVGLWNCLTGHAANVQLRNSFILAFSWKTLFWTLYDSMLITNFEIQIPRSVSYAPLTFYNMFFSRQHCWRYIYFSLACEYWALTLASGEKLQYPNETWFVIFSTYWERWKGGEWFRGLKPSALLSHPSLIVPSYTNQLWWSQLLPTMAHFAWGNI